MAHNSCSHSAGFAPALFRLHPFLSLGRSPLFCIASLFFALFLASQTAYGETLQSAFDVASSGAGYDKYVELQGGATYTGGLSIPYNTSVCIKGNGAILDLQQSTIEIQGTGTQLDIDHCVIINGGNPIYSMGQGALNFVASSGNVVNNTFYMNTVGIRIYATGPQAVNVMNNIIVLNSHAGLLCQLDNEPNVSYNDCWGNTYGNYLIDCG